MKLLNYLFVFLDLLERKDLEKERFTMPNTKRQHYIHIHLSNLYDFIDKGLTGKETNSIKLYWEQKKRLKECFTCVKSDYCNSMNNINWNIK